MVNEIISLQTFGHVKTFNRLEIKVIAMIELTDDVELKGQRHFRFSIDLAFIDTSVSLLREFYLQRPIFWLLRPDHLVETDLVSIWSKVQERNPEIADQYLELPVWSMYGFLGFNLEIVSLCIEGEALSVTTVVIFWLIKFVNCFFETANTSDL